MIGKLPKKLRAVIDLLNLKAAPPIPVVVQAGKPEGAHADIEVENGRFVITLDSRLTTSIATHFLVHEWAHALVWTGGSLIEDHSDAWALVHGRLYRLVFEE